MLPFVMVGGGDFNLIRKLEDKSSGLGDLWLISTFNDFIDTSEIREIARTGPKFTWTNQ